ncbi:replication initiator protein [Rhodococcus triatomae BKS 15-14]|nr:replication initiator protein [Rhodococcus triatomae BKS 15-14]
MLAELGIDTDRWTGIDIAQALTHDGITRGWTWPRTESMTSPLRLVAFRLGQLDWSDTSPTERKVRGRQHTGESASDTAYRLVRARRSVVAAANRVQAPPSSAAHRQALRARFAADRAARKQVMTGMVAAVSVDDHEVGRP